MTKRYYLACLRDTLGSNVSFHAVAGIGYTTDIDKAETYSLQQAQRAWDRGREFDLPLCADQVEALAEWHVDCQYIPSDTLRVKDCEEYVAYLRHRWNGNDVYWLRDGAHASCDITQATVFTNPCAGADAVWIPQVLALASKRRTVNVRLINKRKMTQAAGLITPERIRKARRRRDSGKTRFNCPGCGKIHWQYDPHEFNGCQDIFCGEYRRSYDQEAA